MIDTLYLIRHAKPKLGTGIPYDRPPGPPLDPLGHDEARATAQFLNDCALEKLFVSPLERTLQTAGFIHELTGVPLETEPALAEHEMGEAYEHVRARVEALFERLDAGPYKIVGVVSHGSPIKALLQLLSGDTIDLSKPVFDNGNNTPTAGVWRAGRTEHGFQLELVFTPQITAV